MPAHVILYLAIASVLITVWACLDDWQGDTWIIGMGISWICVILFS